MSNWHFYSVTHNYCRSNFRVNKTRVNTSFRVILSHSLNFVDSFNVCLTAMTAKHILILKLLRNVDILIQLEHFKFNNIVFDRTLKRYKGPNQEKKVQ
jgi:hypothetical protein